MKISKAFTFAIQTKMYFALRTKHTCSSLTAFELAPCCYAFVVKINKSAYCIGADIA